MTGLRLAGWGRRAAALVLDWLLLIAVIVAVGAWTFSVVQAAAFLFTIFVLPSVYQWLMIGRSGQTLGKMALGVRVVRGEDAGRVGYARAAGRAASAWVLGFLVLPLWLAYLWPLWDRRNQTLYDKLVNTIVVRVTSCGISERLTGNRALPGCRGGIRPGPTAIAPSQVVGARYISPYGNVTSRRFKGTLREATLEA